MYIPPEETFLFSPIRIRPPRQQVDYFCVGYQNRIGTCFHSDFREIARTISQFTHQAIVHVDGMRYRNGTGISVMNTFINKQTRVPPRVLRKCLVEWRAAPRLPVVKRTVTPEGHEYVFPIFLTSPQRFPVPRLYVGNG